MMRQIHNWLERRVLLSGAMLLGLLYLQSSTANAGTCAHNPDTPSTLLATTSIAGSITVGRDVPVGAEIYRATFNTNRLARVVCEPGTYTRTRRFLSTPYPLSGYVHPTWGNRVYRTPIPGIGAVIWTSGVPLPTSVTETATVTTILTVATGYDVSLIKIGDVGAGSIRGVDLPVFEYVQMGDNSIRMQYASFVGSLNIVSRTCVTPDVPVNLGTHQMSALAGTGTTTTRVNVPIRLNSCPGFFDAFRNNLTNDDGLSVRSRTANQIRFRVNPVTSVVNAQQGVMALQPDGVNQTATGIGIQMLDTSGAPLVYGSNRPSGLALTTTDNGNYTINLGARYYQTTNTPTSGQANGAATVTLIYE